MKTTAKVICDTVCPRGGPRLTTLELVYPRFILPQINTHRILSKNSESSRAVPIRHRLKATEESPYIPPHIGQNKAGMQAGGLLPPEQARAVQQHISALAVHTADTCRTLAKLGAHKQLVNRYMEPFTYQRTLITGTEWANLFALRIHPDAQPEFMELATAMRDAMANSTPKVGRVHVPYVSHAAMGPLLREQMMVSAARCSRISYKPFTGENADYDKDLAKGTALRTAGHMSPFEHQARVPEWWEYKPSNFTLPWLQFRKEMKGEAVFRGGGQKDSHPTKRKMV